MKRKRSTSRNGSGSAKKKSVKLARGDEEEKGVIDLCDDSEAVHDAGTPTREAKPEPETQKMNTWEDEGLEYVDEDVAISTSSQPISKESVSLNPTLLLYLPKFMFGYGP